MNIPGILGAQDTLTKKEIRKQEGNYLLQNRPWTIEIPLWIPGFAGSFAYGDINIEGEDGYVPVTPIEPPPENDFRRIFKRLFSDDWYLKFFFINKVSYESNRFLAQFDALAGSVGESVTFNHNNTALVDASYRTINFRLFAGYKIVSLNSSSHKFRYELFGYLGTRFHLQKVYSELSNEQFTLDISPAWAEPIIGLLNHLTWKRWLILLQGDYGGYFVESKNSFQFTANAYFRCGKTVSVKAGWNHLYLNHHGTFLEADYKAEVTLSGPSVGVAFHF